MRFNFGVTTYLPNNNSRDHLGSPVRGTASNGDILFTELYTPFGIPYYDSEVNQDQAGYSGHIRDGATDRNYMQARYYDPVMGRFLSVDPVTFMDTGSPGMFNRYGYVENNPMNYTDPTGMIKRGDGLTDDQWEVAKTSALDASGKMGALSEALDVLVSTMKGGGELSAGQENLKNAVQQKWGKSNIRALKAISKNASQMSDTLSEGSDTTISGVASLSGDGVAMADRKNNTIYLAKSFFNHPGGTTSYGFTSISRSGIVIPRRSGPRAPNEQARIMAHEAGHFAINRLRWRWHSKVDTLPCIGYQSACKADNPMGFD